MKFKVTDLDLDLLEKETVLEAQEIWDPDGDRPYDNVYKMVSIGKPPELFLKEKAKFTDDPRQYHDVISPCGHSVEVKVRNPDDVANTLVDLSNKRSDPRRYLKSDWVFIFGVSYQNRNDPEYRLLGTYKWNSFEYTEAKFDWKAEYEQWHSLNEDSKFLNNL